MGKGAGNCFSAEQAQAAAPAPPAPVAPAPAAAPATTTPPAAKNGNKMVRIAVIFYSTYGHVKALAEKMKEGVDSVEGAEATIFQVAETLPEEVLAKMHAPPKADYPVITSAQLTEYDGFLLGFPTRFGMMPAQFKAFIDSTGGLWQSGALVGKPAGIFTSVATQGGGSETTVLTAITQLAHHGMIFVPTGYSFGAQMFDVETVRGGTAYGASTIAGPDGSRQPSQLELDYATYQGKYFAGVAAKLAK